MLVAFLGAVVGAILTVIFTKWFLPDSTKEITSIRQEVSELKRKLQKIEEETQRQREDDMRWAEKFERAAKYVVKVGPSFMVNLPGCTTPLFGLVFPDVDTRTRIQTFLVQKDERYTSFSMRSRSDEQLRRPTIRQVIEETLQQVEQFKLKYPQFVQYL